METRTISSYQSIQSFINNLQGKTDYLFFRGTKEDYLLPSIVPKRNRLSAQQLQYIEKRMQSEFNALTNQKTDSVEQQIKAIICAREHGLCNRMLDWSSTFHIALVFFIPDKTKC